MKGSKFFGKGSSSPAKVSDEAVVAAQKSLDETQHGWKTPGWAKAAGKIFTPPMMKGGGTTEAAKGVADATKGSKKETPKVKTDHKLEVNEDLMKDSPKLEIPSMSAGGFGG
jgi:hypothetical protein